MAIAVSITSCSTERRLAGDFLKKKEPVAVLLLAPDFIYKSSFKVPDVGNFDSLSVEIQDSLLFFSSDLVQYIDDTVFIKDYLKNLSLGLRRFGYTVYQPAASRDFMRNGSKAIIINLAQLQLEEYYNPINDEVSFSDEEQYTNELFITALNVNSWFELSRLNDTDTVKRMLYSSTTYSDYFDGGFRYLPFTGDVKYLYTIDTLTVDQVYYNVANTGLLYAGYIFDYLMNEYIARNMPKGRSQNIYFTYDRDSGMIRKSKGEGFTIIR